MAHRCQERRWSTCGFVSTLAWSLEPGALKPPQTVVLEENAFLSHPGAACLSPAPQPQHPDSWSPSWSTQRCQSSRTTLAIDFRERLRGYVSFFFFFPWRSCSLQPNISAQGSTKLIKIDFSQGSRNGKRGKGSNHLHPKNSAQAMCSPLGEGTTGSWEGITSCHFLSPETPCDSTRASVLTQGGTAGRRSLCQEGDFYHHLKES